MKKTTLLNLIIFCSMQTLCMEQNTLSQETIPTCLPQETLQTIASNLGIKDICNMKYVCKWFNNSIDYWISNPIIIKQENNLLWANGFIHFTHKIISPDRQQQNTQKNYTFFVQNIPTIVQDDVKNLLTYHLKQSFSFDLLSLNKQSNLHSFDFNTIFSKPIMLHIVSKLYPNIRDKYGNTALMSACRNNNTEIVKSLLQNNPDLNIQDNESNTTLVWACHNNNPEIIKLLLQNNPDLNIQNIYGDTALIWACCRNNTEIVKLLLQNNPDLNIQNKYGKTALMWACCYNNPEIIKLLLQNNPDLNIQDNSGNTALIWACYNINPETITLLLKQYCYQNSICIISSILLFLCNKK